MRSAVRPASAATCCCRLHASAASSRRPARSKTRPCRSSAAHMLTASTPADSSTRRAQSRAVAVSPTAKARRPTVTVKNGDLPCSTSLASSANCRATSSSRPSRAQRHAHPALRRISPASRSRLVERQRLVPPPLGGEDCREPRRRQPQRPQTIAPGPGHARQGLGPATAYVRASLTSAASMRALAA